VPKNLYLIGTMNSADRSLPPLDVVVKRRFGLFQVEPDPEVVKALDLLPQAKALAEGAKKIIAEHNAAPAFNR